MEIDRIVTLFFSGSGHLDVLSKEQAWSESNQEQCARPGEKFTNTQICNYTLGEKSRYLLTLSNTYLLTYFSTYGNVDPNALLDICFDCRSSLDTSIHTIQSEPPTEVDKGIFASHLLKLFEDMIINTRTHKDTRTQMIFWRTPARPKIRGCYGQALFTQYKEDTSVSLGDY